jgi:hypothetical protein
MRAAALILPEIKKIKQVMIDEDISNAILHIYMSLSKHLAGLVVIERNQVFPISTNIRASLF